MASKINFDFSESMTLLKLWCEPEWQKRFTTAKKSHSSIWHDLATQLSSSTGKERTGKQVSDRIRNLKKEFYKIKRQMGSGAPKPDWPYYEYLQKVLGETPQANTQENAFDSLSNELKWVNNVSSDNECNEL